MTRLEDGGREGGRGGGYEWSTSSGILSGSMPLPVPPFLPPSLPPSLPHLEVLPGRVHAAFYHLASNFFLVGISEAVLSLHGLDASVFRPDLGREGGREGRREGGNREGGAVK